MLKPALTNDSHGLRIHPRYINRRNPAQHLIEKALQERNNPEYYHLDHTI